MLLCGKSAVITGSTKGVGLGNARAPAAAIANIVP
jgi:NAD(P)-dependent dehydrogenase (short-subunit alcohol dehydrogenase family)